MKGKKKIESVDGKESKSQEPPLRDDPSRAVPTVRDQGDGAAIPDVVATVERQTRQKVQSPFSQTLEVDFMQLFLSVISLFTHFWGLEHPRAVVFDEIHYVRFAAMYIERTFFFDVQPPLGKLLIALGGYIGGCDGGLKLNEIGQEYGPDVPVWHLRFFPALCGSLLVPVVYEICVDMQLSRWSAALAACLLIFENSLLTQSKFMLMDPILLLSLAMAILSYLKFKTYSTSPFCVHWWLWLCSLGLSCTAAVAVKYIGLLTVLLLMVLVARDYWRLLPDRTISHHQLVRQLLARVSLLVALPVLLYAAVFYVHLSILTRAGPHDDIMTSRFQASLEGGLSAITKGQPLEIAYGSQVTLRRTYGQLCWLHSHQHVYPVRYPDGRGSSHQQQVTCYPFKDVNNWWLIKDPSKNTLVVSDPVRPVKHGDIIQIIHGMSSRALNSHDVGAPVSPQYQEVSCYIDYNVSMPTQNLWKVEILNRDVAGDSWKTIQSHVNLIHVNTSQVLKLSGSNLPDWGFHQMEVVTDRLKGESAIWNVEEHRYTRNPDEEEREKDLRNVEMIPIEPVELGFFSKFWELQVKMLTATKMDEGEHLFSSEPLEWPFMERNVAYWKNLKSEAQVHLLGNVVTWCSGSLGVVVYAALLVFHLLRRRRQCHDIHQDQWDQYVVAGEILFAGYLVNYGIFFAADKTLFLFQYLPALVFKIILLCVVMEHVYHLIWSPHVQKVYTMLIIVWLTTVINTFMTFSLFTYGTRSPSPDEIAKLKWKDSWEFIIGVP